MATFVVEAPDLIVDLDKGTRYRRQVGGSLTVSVPGAEFTLPAVYGEPLWRDLLTLAQHEEDGSEDPDL